VPCRTRMPGAGAVEDSQDFSKKVTPMLRLGAKGRAHSMGREDTTRMGSTSWQGQVPVVSRSRTPQAAKKEEAAHRRPR
jgi:hypothetical protein